MTVSSEINRSGPYVGNGVTTVFDYDFKILHASHLRVIRTAPDGTESFVPGYDVSGVGNNNGGSITLPGPLATGYSLTIFLNVPFVQETDLENQGAYYAETVEQAFDLSTMRDLQLKEMTDRALTARPGVTPLVLIEDIPPGNFLVVGEGGELSQSSIDVTAVAAIPGQLSAAVAARDAAYVARDAAYSARDGAISARNAASAHAAAASASATLTASAVRSELFSISAAASNSAASAGASANDAANAAASVAAAVDAVGGAKFYDTHALAVAALGGLVNGTIVEINADETHDGDRTRYVVQSAALVYKLTLPNTRRDLAEAVEGSGIIETVAALDGFGNLRRHHIAGGYSLKAFGAPGIGDDWTSVLEDAIESGEAIIIPIGEFLIEQSALRSDLMISGEDRRRSIIKLADGSAANVFLGNGLSRIDFRDLTIDGNYENQADQTLSGILLQDCTDVTFDRVCVKDAGGSGFSMQGTVSARTRYLFCEAIHNGYGEGASSTGFNGHGDDITLIGCLSENNWRGGFKQFGKRVVYAGGNVSRNNGSHGFSLDFSGSDQSDVYHYGSMAYENAGDGFYTASETSSMELHGVTSRLNGMSGLRALNNVHDLRIFGGDFRNNCQDPSAVVSGTWQRAAICLMSSFSGEYPYNISIVGADCRDTQVSPTQDYGVYIADNCKNISIDGGTDVRGNVVAGIRTIPAELTQTISPSVKGYSGNHHDHSVVSVTGTTSPTPLKTHTIAANTRHIGTVIRIRAGGTVTGTAGTKIISALFGAVGIIVANEAAGDTQYWSFEAILTWATTTRVVVEVRGSEAGGTSQISSTTISQATNAALTVGARVTLGNAGDVVTQEYLHVETLR